MFETRRKFLWGMALAAHGFGVAAQSPSDQTHRTPVPPPKPDPLDKDDIVPTSATKKRLEANDKDIKKRVEKLFQLASELKEEVEKTDSSQVLSLVLVKKAEEIEKLAKEIKSRSAG